ncbi:hypothetical protein Fot_37291 [Forsythia ovata]|uniref:Uncharacterized protein n=1 Tax=Forsythia ovata TaxID=205694 RepID=A0ABD1RYK5_9LAMI
MSDKDINTRTRQTGEQPKGGDERALEVTQPPRRGRHSRARMARNIEVMAEQMLEMQRTYAPCATYVSALPAPRVRILTQGRRRRPILIRLVGQDMPCFEEMKREIHPSTHIMGTTQEKTMETKTFLLNIHKN